MQRNKVNNVDAKKVELKKKHIPCILHTQGRWTAECHISELSHRLKRERFFSSLLTRLFNSLNRITIYDPVSNSQRKSTRHPRHSLRNSVKPVLLFNKVVAERFNPPPVNVGNLNLRIIISHTLLRPSKELLRSIRLTSLGLLKVINQRRRHSLVDTKFAVNLLSQNLRCHLGQLTADSEP